MTVFSVTIHRKVVKRLNRVPSHILVKLDSLIEDLKTDPGPSPKWDVSVLSGLEDTFRVRIGGYRVIYFVNWKTRNIEVIRVSPRGSAYGASSE